MKGSHAVGFSLLISLVMLTGGFALSSEKGHDHSNLPQTAITLEQAIDAAKSEVAGRVLEAELEQEDGKAVYEVEMAGANGQIRELTVDAQSGKVLKNEVEEDDHEDHDSEDKD